MKEIIAYIGGGFLAISIGLGMYFVYLEFGKNWQEIAIYENDGNQAEESIREAYTKAKSKMELTFTICENARFRIQTPIEMKNYILVADGGGAAVDYEIVQIRHEESGRIALRRNGIYYFNVPGVYKVYLRCMNQEYCLRIPVNVYGGTK